MLMGKDQQKVKRAQMHSQLELAEYSASADIDGRSNPDGKLVAKGRTKRLVRMLS